MTTRGTLYLVATPIGHLGDITDRAKDVLASVDVVAAEDTRRTRQLLNHLEIKKKLISLHAHNEAQRIDTVKLFLDEGQEVALVSDAGTPLISDPGERLVAALAESGHDVVSVPGPCAAIVALTVSGLASDRFTFVGFLPRTAGKANKLIATLVESAGTQIFYESPRRTEALLVRLQEQLGDRRAVLCRELTKMHEEVVRGSLSTLIERAKEGLRGEVVVLVEGADAIRATQSVDEGAVERQLRAGEKTKGIARDLAQRTGLSSNAAYAKVLAIKNRIDMSDSES